MERLFNESEGLLLGHQSPLRGRVPRSRGAMLPAPVVWLCKTMWLPAILHA